jgi:hypothetical protein
MSPGLRHHRSDPLGDALARSPAFGDSSSSGRLCRPPARGRQQGDAFTSQAVLSTQACRLTWDITHHTGLILRMHGPWQVRFDWVAPGNAPTYCFCSRETGRRRPMTAGFPAGCPSATFRVLGQPLLPEGRSRRSSTRPWKRAGRRVQRDPPTLMPAVSERSAQTSASRRVDRLTWCTKPSGLRIRD